MATKKTEDAVSIAPFKQEAPDITRFVEKANEDVIRSEMARISVNTDEECAAADERMTGYQELSDEIDRSLDPLIKESNGHTKNLRAFKAQFSEPVGRIIKAYSASILNFRKQKRLRKEAEDRRLNEEEAKKTKARQEEEARKLLEAGRIAEARQVLQMPPPAPSIAATTAAPPSLDSHGVRDNWSAEIVDPMAVLNEVVAGRLQLEAVITFNMPFFNAISRRMKKENIGIPGVKGVNKEVLVRK